MYQVSIKLQTILVGSGGQKSKFSMTATVVLDFVEIVQEVEKFPGKLG